MSKKKKTIMFSSNLEEKVNAYAEKNNMSQSEVINLAVTYFFKHDGRDFPELSQILDVVFKNNFKVIQDELKNVYNEQQQIQSTMKNFLEKNGIEEGNGNKEHLKRIADALDMMNIKNV